MQNQACFTTEAVFLGSRWTQFILIYLQTETYLRFLVRGSRNLQNCDPAAPLCPWPPWSRYRAGPRTGLPSDRRRKTRKMSRYGVWWSPQACGGGYLQPSRGWHAWPGSRGLPSGSRFPGSEEGGFSCPDTDSGHCGKTWSSRYLRREEGAGSESEIVSVPEGIIWSPTRWLASTRETKANFSFQPDLRMHLSGPVSSSAF